MKHIKKIIICLFAGLCLFLVCVNLIFYKSSKDLHQNRNVVINRINRELAVPGKEENIDTAQLIRDHTIKEYGPFSVPLRVSFYRLEQAESMGEIKAEAGGYLTGVYDEEGHLLGFAEYIFRDPLGLWGIVLINGMAILCFLILLAFLLYINKKILSPFSRFRDYPEELAKGRMKNKLPETKNRYFGKFIWGMNMLSDKLASDQKKLQTLEKDKQMLLTSVAHGVKTPVANIKLYANAIQTGLYREDGEADPKDAEIAEKIEKNAMEIEKIVQQLISISSTSLCSYAPKTDWFYLEELAELLEKEYGKRLSLRHIEFHICCPKNPMIHSDREGLFTMLSQLMENAIKYGDGKLISVSLEKQEDGYYFIVKNTGKLLNESEIPFIFQSFWRGSNAKETEGNGVGLFVVKEMAHKLSGEVFAKCIRETNEMEFTIFIS